MDINFEVKVSGPVFDGRWSVIMGAYKFHIEDVLGDRAVKLIRDYLPTQYMYLGHNGGTPQFNPVPDNAGWLVSRIETHRDSPDLQLVTDGGYPATIYGPWIEGVGPGNFYMYHTKRNTPPRRFPGYHTFRKMTTVLNSQATEIANAEFQPYLRELND